MTRLSLLSAALLAATTFAAPAMAQENVVVRHTQMNAYDGPVDAYDSVPAVQRFASRTDYCVRAPDVGAFASDPYTVPPCLPNTMSWYR
jgi:hypothetical protein